MDGKQTADKTALAKRREYNRQTKLRSLEWRTKILTMMTPGTLSAMIDVIKDGFRGNANTDLYFTELVIADSDVWHEDDYDRPLVFYRFCLPKISPFPFEFARDNSVYRKSGDTAQLRGLLDLEICRYIPLQTYRKTRFRSAEHVYGFGYRGGCGNDFNHGDCYRYGDQQIVIGGKTMQLKDLTLLSLDEAFSLGRHEEFVAYMAKAADHYRALAGAVDDARSFVAKAIRASYIIDGRIAEKEGIPVEKHWKAILDKCRRDASDLDFEDSWEPLAGKFGVMAAVAMANSSDQEREELLKKRDEEGRKEAKAFKPLLSDTYSVDGIRFVPGYGWDDDGGYPYAYLIVSITDGRHLISLSELIDHEQTEPIDILASLSKMADAVGHKSVGTNVVYKRLYGDGETSLTLTGTSLSEFRKEYQSQIDAVNQTKKKD